MEHRYFHPGSSIHGVDINDASIVPQAHNITASIGDLADPYFWDEVLPLLGQLDIVIDDGGHTMDQQINAFNAIYHTMAKDGVYLVEDTHTKLVGWRLPRPQARPPPHLHGKGTRRHPPADGVERQPGQLRHPDVGPAR